MMAHGTSLATECDVPGGLEMPRYSPCRTTRSRASRNAARSIASDRHAQSSCSTSRCGRQTWWYSADTPQDSICRRDTWQGRGVAGEGRCRRTRAATRSSRTAPPNRAASSCRRTAAASRRGTLARRVCTAKQRAHNCTAAAPRPAPTGTRLPDSRPTMPVVRCWELHTPEACCCCCCCYSHCHRQLHCATAALFTHMARSPEELRAEYHRPPRREEAEGKAVVPNHTEPTSSPHSTFSHPRRHDASHLSVLRSKNFPLRHMGEDRYNKIYGSFGRPKIETSGRSTYVWPSA